MRRLMVPLFLLIGLIFVVTGSAAAKEHVVVVLEIEAPVTQVMVDYFARGIADAEEGGAEAVLIILNTPGGSVAQTLDIVSLFRNSEVPIIVYIGPAGAQAASAGSIITMAAHASGMAPETVIGAASPVSGTGADLEETLYRKAIEDMSATVRSLTERRGDPAVTLAVEMIVDARAVHAHEALSAGLIDVVAADPTTLLEQLDGTELMVNGTPVVLQTADVRQEPIVLRFIEKLLLMLTNPILIGILLTIGAQAILIEISNPGGWVAGFLGALCIGLALYGAGQLPVNWLGMGFIFLAFVLFLLEIKAATHGALAIVGTVTLFAGFMVLFNSPGSPEFAQISIGAAIAITLPAAAFFLFLAAMVARTFRQQPVTGIEGLVGKTAVARNNFTPSDYGYTGSIMLNGEIWRAETNSAVMKGDRVELLRIEGMVAHVLPLEAVAVTTGEDALVD